MGAFRPPADAWSRRDFMRNGSYSIALLCTFATTESLKGPTGRADLGRAARAGRLAVRAVPRDLPIAPSSRRSRRKQRRRRLRRRHQGGPGRDPARLRDADLRLRGHLPRADDPRPQGPPGDRAPAATSCRSTPTSTCTAATSRPRTTGIRWTSSQPGAGVRLHVPERAGRGVPLVPRPRARPHGADALLRPRRHLPAATTSARRSSSCRRASTTCRSCSPTTRSTRTGRSATPRTSTSASAATRCSSTARSRRGWRVQRRHLPAALPQRVQRALLRPAARQRPPDAADRLRRRAARDAGRAHELPAAPGRADRGADRLPRASSRARRSCCRTRRRRRDDEPVMRFDVVDGGGAEEARIPRGRMRDAARSCPSPTPRRRWDLSLLDAGRRAVADRQPRASTPTASTCAPRLRHDRAVAVAQPVQPRAPDAPARDAVPGRRALDRASSTRASAAGRTRSACCPGETVTVQPWFAPYAGRYVFHCHSLEHGDKAMMLQLEVGDEARGLLLGVGARAGALAAPASAADQVVTGQRHARRGTSRTSSVAPGETVTWTFAGHDAGPQRQPRRRDAGRRGLETLQRRRSALPAPPDARTRSRPRARTSSSARCTGHDDGHRARSARRRSAAAARVSR